MSPAWMTCLEFWPEESGWERPGKSLGRRVGRSVGRSVGGMASGAESFSPARANPALASSSAPAAVAHRQPPAAAAVGASSGSGAGARSDAGCGREAPAAALSGAGGAAPAARPILLAAIQRTYPKLSPASCQELEQLVKDGHCSWPEVDEQVPRRRSEDFRAQQPGATMSSVLVSCPATGSTLLDDDISADDVISAV